MLSGLSDVNSAGVEYYFAGQQTGTGMRWFIGDNGQYARWTPNDGLEIAGKITVKSGSTGLTEFVEYETLQDTIDALEDNMIDVKQALFDINSDTVFDDSEKAQLRTVWEQMNGLASLDAVGSGGSYLSTVALLEELEYEGETVTLSFHGQELIFNGNSLEFHYIGVADFTMAFYNVREYLRLMKLYEAGAVQNFERQHLAELLTKYNKLQEDLLAKAQKRYADNTAGAQLEEFIEGEYAQDISDIYDQIDKKAETWVQSTDPAAAWTTPAVKREHIGDLWWNPNNVEVYGVGAGASAVYRYNNTTRVYEWKETTVPQEIFDKIDGKSSIYIVKPTTYKERDLWIIGSEVAAADIPIGCTAGDLVVAIQDSDSYSPLHWVKKVKYTDDTALQSFIENEYADDIDDLQEQIDKKAETWAQTTDPAANWSAAEKAEHLNDIWWNKSTSIISGVKAGECAIYKLVSGTYQWVVTPVPEEVFDEIDGKAALYIVKPVNGYRERDMWIIEQGATNLPAGATIGDLVVATRNNTQYIASDWQKKVKYTPMTPTLRAPRADSCPSGSNQPNQYDNNLDVAEKKQIRTLWENINGKASLTVIDADGSYQNALNIASDKGYTEGDVVLLKFGNTDLVYNGQDLLFYNYGYANLYTALITLRAYLASVELYDDTAFNHFDRAWMAYLFTKYYNAEAQFISMPTRVIPTVLSRMCLILSLMMTRLMQQKRELFREFFLRRTIPQQS